MGMIKYNGVNRKSGFSILEKLKETISSIGTYMNRNEKDYIAIYNLRWYN